MTFLNSALLFGLAAVAIPPIVHLFNRRKFDEVDWAAMQFLNLGQKTKRKLFLEQFLLMLLRVSLIAVVVLAFASPQLTGRYLGTRTATGPRHLVILIDGSGSMAFAPEGKPDSDAAKLWATRAIDHLAPGDRVAIFQVNRQAVPVVGALTADRALAKGALELLAPPSGFADWPQAIQTATTLLDTVKSNRQILILSDNQRSSWADESTLAKWELLSKDSLPLISVINVAPDRPAEPKNASLEALFTSHGVSPAGREIEFRANIATANSNLSDVGTLQLEIDGRPALELPASNPVVFRQKFSVGSHVVTLKLPPDALPSDNRQDYAIDVLAAVPVLIVDGSATDVAGSEYLRDALAPRQDPEPTFVIRTVRIKEWSSLLLSQDVKGPGTPPRVLVLANIEKIAVDQQQQIEKFLNAGGSVLIALGDRCDAAEWNRTAFRGGQGFLPARLVEPVGDEAELTQAKSLLIAGFAHPALDIFKDPLPGGLQTATFPRRWKVDAAAGINGSTGIPIAMFSDRLPFLVERSFGKGRVLLAAHPLDRSWRTNLHRLPDFVRLAHELMYYLAGSRTAERNLSPGQSIVFTPQPEESPGVVTLHSPAGPVRSIPCASWPEVIDGTNWAGPYRVLTPSGRATYFCVRPDPKESILTPCSAEDRERVSKILPQLQYISSTDEMTSGADERTIAQELWWILLMLMIGFLILETWYTRSLVRRG